MTTKLGDMLATLEEPGGLEALLINAGELPLLAELKGVVALTDMQPGAFAALSVRRFVERANSEDWASLISRANENGTGDAMGAVVSVILRRAVLDAREVFQ